MLAVIERMKPAHRAFYGFLLVVLVAGFQCSPPKTLHVAAITGAGHTEKPDRHTVELIFAGVGDLLRSRGFGGTDQHQPYGYRLIGGREYGDDFRLGPSIVCLVRINRRSVNVRFYELQFHRDKSQVLGATDEQRTTVRALARDIESYLRANLPASYELQVCVY
jgi:hypothetical protein